MPPDHGERWLPNEIFAVIIGNLGDDRPSLRNLALVCKNFTPIAQSLIFQVLSLDDWPAAGMKGYSTKFLRFVRQLHIAKPDQCFNESVVVGLLNSMTALTFFAFTSPKTGHFRAIEYSSLPTALKILRITGLDAVGLSSFARMLLSLKVLEVLAISYTVGRIEEHIDIVLPSSLKVASFCASDKALLHAIGSGLESSRSPPSLRILVLDLIPSADIDLHDCTKLWNKLGPVTQIVVMRFALKNLERGFNGTKLTWLRNQTNYLLPSLIISFQNEVPYSVRELTIDIRDSRQKGQENPASMPREMWSRLDDNFLSRYKRGLLTRICFRCTNRDEFFHFDRPYFSEHEGVQDRSILDHIESLLPKSKSAGFLEVDHDMKTFVPTM